MIQVRASRIKSSGFWRDLRGASSTETAATNQAAQLDAGLLGEGCPTTSRESTFHWGVRLRDSQGVVLHLGLDRALVRFWTLNVYTLGTCSLAVRFR